MFKISSFRADRLRELKDLYKIFLIIYRTPKGLWAFERVYNPVFRSFSESEKTYALKNLKKVIKTI